VFLVIFIDTREKHHSKHFSIITVYCRSFCLIDLIEEGRKASLRYFQFLKHPSEMRMILSENEIATKIDTIVKTFHENSLAFNEIIIDFIFCR
jgi:hypothetical protein